MGATDLSTRFHAAGLHGTGKLLAEQPDALLPRVYFFRQFLAGQQADDALFGTQHALCRQCRHRGILGACQCIRIAKFKVVEGVLSVQVYAETAVGVQLAVLLVKVHIQFLIDDLQRTAHGHGAAVCFQHPAIAGVHPHAGANGGLRQIHRCNVAALEFLQRRAQLSFQLCNKAPAGGLGCICRALAAHQHNGGGKGIGADTDCSPFAFCAHWPCAGDGKACPDDGAEHGLPAGGGGFGVLVRVALLVGVVDGYRNIFPGVLVNLLTGVQHSVLKEIPRLFSAALKAVGGRHQFFRLGHQHGAEQLGVGVFQRLPHPDIEEIGQVCIADVVIIGRVGGDHYVTQTAVALSIKLTDL